MLRERLEHALVDGPRQLRPEEVALIIRMLEHHPLESEFATRSSGYYVQDMNDGGMGSIQFLAQPRTERKFGMELITAEYLDQDGIVVRISIITDEQGNLYEVDFWKVDFSPLIRYPAPNQLHIAA